MAIPRSARLTRKPHKTADVDQAVGDIDEQRGDRRDGQPLEQRTGGEGRARRSTADNHGGERRSGAGDEVRQRTVERTAGDVGGEEAADNVPDSPGRRTRDRHRDAGRSDARSHLAMETDWPSATMENAPAIDTNCGSIDGETHGTENGGSTEGSTQCASPPAMSATGRALRSTVKPAIRPISMKGSRWEIRAVATVTASVQAPTIAAPELRLPMLRGEPGQHAERPAPARQQPGPGNPARHRARSGSPRHP